MKIDLHCHTIYSKNFMNMCDSNIKPKELVKISIRRGLNGLAVTDHETTKAYPYVKKIARKIDPDFLIIPGAEIYDTRFMHVLILGVEEIPKYRGANELVDKIRENAGVVVIPHPFTAHPLRRSKISLNELKIFDGLEVLNAYDWNYCNDRTERIAEILNLGITAGSDCHKLRDIGLAYTICEDPLKDIRKRKTRVGGFESPWSFKIANLFGFGLV